MRKVRKTIDIVEHSDDISFSSEDDIKNDISGNNTKTIHLVDDIQLTLNNVGIKFCDSTSRGHRILKNNENIKEEENFIQICDNLIIKINQTSKELKDDIRHLKKIYTREIKNNNEKKGRGYIKKKKTGFTTDEQIPDSLAILIGVDMGTMMPRTALKKKVYAVIKERGLFWDGDKRVLRADKEIMDVFNLSEDVNKCTDVTDRSGFTFFTIQKHIASCYREHKLANADNRDMRHNEKYNNFNKKKDNNMLLSNI
jgi:hypothetical protein